MKITLKELRLLIENIVNESLTYGDTPPEVKKAMVLNKIISVAFVRRDGSVRHMAFMSKTNNYEKSDRQQTQKMIDVAINNNLLKIIDVNLYNKEFRISGDRGKAASAGWRSFKLDEVLAFMIGGVLYDMRDENKILKRYGKDVYNLLTNNMVKALRNDEIDGSMTML